MPRIVRCGVIQAKCEWSPEKYSLAQIKEKMIAKHEKMIADAAKKNVQVLGLQELFYGPYFCAEQNAKWYELTESVPNGPTLARMQKLARKHKMVLVVPIYEVEMAGVYLQHRRRHRCRRHVPRQISQAPHPPLPSGLLGKVLFHAGQPRAIRSSRRATAASASTSATTAISPRARAFSA